MFLKLNVATIPRLDHRRLFLTCEVHLHEIIDEHEEISRFWNDNKNSDAIYLSYIKQLKAKTSQNTFHLSHV